MTQTKQRVAAISILASGSMAAAKFIVGVLVGSIALVSDALHSLVDLIATIITWIVVRIADRPADAKHHYGHGKLESLSALGVTALLYVLAGGIVVESFGRLREGAQPPTLSAAPFAVLIVDIAVNYWRARVLHKTAMETKSHALEADALHFSSDVYVSLAVIMGLALAALGFNWGDAAAAIAVACIISLLGLSLARSTVQALLDRAPEGVAERVEAAIRDIPGVVDVERVRVRNVGPRHFVDTTVHVARTLPIDRINEIKQHAHDVVNRMVTDADLSFTAVPVAQSSESVSERIMVIARNQALAIHHVTVHDLGDRLTVGIDLEVDGDMPLARAHEISHRLEAAIRAEFGQTVEVDTHIEPLQPGHPTGTDAPRERVDAVRQTLVKLAAEQNVLHEIHYVRVRNSDAGEVVNFHFRARPDMLVSAVHEHVDGIERALRRAYPSIKRVISHAEPVDPRKG
jgi:cation diffusion facilitator family transporter